ncbi:MAG: hypothetical protein H6696_14190 [Deferribacteres bacterium]|nr:hypothetical protein [candidate division KSB1 bacterium]MCB9503078.1 hypothetical protein [Deferribacteres bacterium]
MNSKQRNQIIIDYIRHNLSPTPEERKFISERYNELKEILKGRTFQSGSYRRFTSTTPVNDLDVIYVLPERMAQKILESKTHIDPSDIDMNNVLDSLADLLQDFYSDQVEIRVQPHSVGIFWGSDDDFSIDVVPAIPARDNMYWVPESSHLSINKRRKFYKDNKDIDVVWIKSDPVGYIKQAEVLDKRTNGCFRKGTKFVKKWKHGCKNENPDFPLKSFHLELIITEILQKNIDATVFDVVVLFWQQLKNFLESPKFPDRANPEIFIDEYLSSLTTTERNIVFEYIDEALFLLGELNSATSEAAVIKSMEKLLKIPLTQPSISSVIVGENVERRTKAYSKPYRW